MKTKVKYTCRICDRKIEDELKDGFCDICYDDALKNSFTPQNRKKILNLNYSDFKLIFDDMRKQLENKLIEDVKENNNYYKGNSYETIMLIKKCFFLTKILEKKHKELFSLINNIIK